LKRPPSNAELLSIYKKRLNMASSGSYLNSYRENIGEKKAA
jgi:hypothetical protein